MGELLLPHRLSRRCSQCLVAALLCTAAGAGAETGTEVPDDGINFRALEAHETRQALLDILRRRQEEHDARGAESRMFAEMAGLLQSLPELPDDDAKLTLCMRLRDGISELSEALRTSRLRRLAVLDAVRVQASARSLTTEAGKLLRETDHEVRLMMGHQQVEARKLVGLSNRVDRIVATTPPPAVFTNKAGLTMRLVGQGQDSFYVSTAPVPRRLYREFLASLPSTEALAAWEDFDTEAPDEDPATGVTWGGAQRYCHWLSAGEQALYALPTVAHTSALASASLDPVTAIWLQDVWDPGDYATRRDLKRFAVDFATVWDPEAKLGGGKLLGEVPFARYHGLGFYVTTPTNTGIDLRVQRLRAALP